VGVLGVHASALLLAGARVQPVSLRRELAAARQEIERLRLQVRMLQSPAQSGRRPCPYCGVLSRGKACPSHRDLLAVDPLRKAAV